MPSLAHQVLTRVIPVLRGSGEVIDPERVRRDVLAAQQKADRSPPRRVAARFDVRRSEQLSGTPMPGYELRARGAEPQRTVLYLHGGGYVSGLDRFHWRYAARLARHLGVRVVLPDYPLAPTHSWRDAIPALVELFEQLAVGSPRGVVLMGDSAGGGLAVSLAEQVARRPGPQPTHLVTFAPWVDLTGETPGTEDAARQDPWLSLGKLRLYGSWWGAGDPHGPQGSPLFGDLAGLPPTLVLCGTRDLLVPQSRALVARGRDAGVEVSYVEEPGLLHVYPLLPVPEARRAFDEVAGFLGGRGRRGHGPGPRPAGPGVHSNCKRELHLAATTNREGTPVASGTIVRNLDWQRLRDLASRLTTPLHPDDYLALINPLWSARELRGRVERVIPETDDAATLIIKPGWGWSFDHQAGQYIGIGVEIDGRFHWRSYSLSSTPTHAKGAITITVRAMPEGFLSDHLVRGLRPGTIVRLAAPAGEFTLPNPPPPKTLFVVGGSGITPVMSMLRTLDRRDTMPDAMLIYSSPTEDRMIFRDELRRLAAKHPSLTVVERFTDTEGIFTFDELESVCPDWRERGTWACGPTPMLDAAEEYWEQAGLEDQLHLERFSVALGDGDGDGGGTITFVNSGKKIEVDGATTILEAGEQAGVGMPYGCRIGICHTCTITMASGRIKDLRNGEEHQDPNEAIQTCVTAARGDVTLNI